MGGIIGVGMGRMEGETIPQTVGGHIGLISSVLLHRGCICPLTQAHWQEAHTPVGTTKRMMAERILSFIGCISCSLGSRVLGVTLQRADCFGNSIGFAETLQIYHNRPQLLTAAYCK